MDRQAELRQLYEVKTKLEEIESLESAIKKKQNEIESKRNYLRGLSLYDTSHATRAEKKHYACIKKIHNRIKNANIVKFCLIIIGALVPYIILGMHAVKSFLNFLQYTDNAFLVSTFEDYSITANTILLSLPIVFIYIATVLIAFCISADNLLD